MVPRHVRPFLGGRFFCCIILFAKLTIKENDTVMKMKDTLHLGKTKFPMRGNLPNREGNWQQEWEENNIYERRQKK